MNKPCYTEYVRHAMRFYSRYLNHSHFRNKVDKSNWYACHNVLKEYSTRDKDILVYVYGAFDTTEDNVYVIATRYHIHQNIVWDMMKDFERKVAIERGLWI